MRYSLLSAIFFLLSGFITVGNAQEIFPEADETFSLLTCAPGDNIYLLFGHTAIRYRNPARGIDMVYNYGVFSFDEPNFIWRFASGKPDYVLEVRNFENFSNGYAKYNRAIWEQVLDLKPEEKVALLQLLAINYLPENRVYRYNYFYDNCSTRARDIIEKSIQGSLIYPEKGMNNTFRKVIYESSDGYEWSRFGMDFCLGADADRILTYREQMFAPFYLMEAFSQAKILTDSGNERPLVTETSQVVFPTGPGQSASWLITPLRAFLLLFICITALTIWGIKKEKNHFGEST